MKRDKIIYWIATGLLCYSLALAGFIYLTGHKAAEAFSHLGFPTYFQVELVIAKIVGTLVLILPVVPSRIKVRAYGGIFMVLAFIAHISVNSIGIAIQPLVAFCLCAGIVLFS